MTSKGSVRQRHSRRCPSTTHKCHGPWYWHVDLGVDPVTGKRLRQTKSGYRTRRDAQEALDQFTAQMAITGGRSQGLTVGRWLDQWLASLHRVSPTTMARYEGIVRLHLKPLIGHLMLVDLSPEDIDSLLIARISQPTYRPEGRQGNRYANQSGLTSAGVNRIFGVLRASLGIAAKRRLITWNPAIAVEPPKETNKPGVAWTPAEAAAFLDCVATDRLYALWHLVLLTGTRRGELCGLRWDYLDLENRVWYVKTARVQVRGTIFEKAPKSKAGTRTIYLDQETVEVLKAHRIRQTEERLAAGPAWIDSGYVFVQPDGRPLSPEVVSRTWRDLVGQSDLPNARLHDGRHTSTTTAIIYAGLPEQVMIERVGHAKVETNRRYQQVHEPVHRNAAEAIAAQYRRHRQSPSPGAAHG